MEWRPRLPCSVFNSFLCLHTLRYKVFVQRTPTFRLASCIFKKQESYTTPNEASLTSFCWSWSHKKPPLNEEDQDQVLLDQTSHLSRFSEGRCCQVPEAAEPRPSVFQKKWTEFPPSAFKNSASYNDYATRRVWIAPGARGLRCAFEYEG